MTLWPIERQCDLEEIIDLLKVVYIREVQFPIWLANIMLVPKAVGKQRVCVNF